MGAPNPHDQLIRPHLIWWALVHGGLTLFIAMSFSLDVHEFWIANVHYLPDQFVLQWGCVAALALHLWEGWYCHRLAGRLGLTSSARAWGWQSFLVGYPSTRLLLQLRRTLEAQADLQTSTSTPGVAPETA
jgi:hypothetical protein